MIALLRSRSALSLALVGACTFGACQTVAQSSSIEPLAYDTTYEGPREELVVGRFSNSSSYLRGVFTGGPDRIGGQARELLSKHLAQTNRFILREPALNLGSDRGFVVTGQVTELGPENDVAVHAAVTLNVVEVETSRVVYSVRGEGTHELAATEAASFRSTAGYDETVTSAVLDRALSRAVSQLVGGLERRDWGFFQVR